MPAHPASHRGRGKIWTDLKVCPYNCYEILRFAQNDMGEMLRMTVGIPKHPRLSSVENISFVNYNAQDDCRLPHPRGAVGNKGEAR